ncbi:MAG TPA: DNA polymerase III subunit delta [Clostridiaceae bacterium]|nr:DNA polymerase III subunit delta [Clostridiaceae bacterium]
MDYSQLNKAITAGEIASLYLIYGEEDWLIQQLIQSLIKAVIAPGAETLDLVVIDVAHQPQTLDTARIALEVKTLPFISEKKLVMLKNTDLFVSASGAGKAQTDENRKEIRDLITDLPDTTVLVFVETKANLSQKSLLSAFEKRGGIKAEIRIQDDRTLQSWVNVGCKSQRLSIDPEAAISLIDRCEGQMREIRTELEKLFLYLGWSGDKKITLELVDLVCRPDNRGSIFDLTDAISSGDAEKALQVLDLLLLRKEPVPLILFMLHRHIRQLLAAYTEHDSRVLASRMRLRPFVANKLRLQARRFSPHKLASIYELMFQTDLRIKKGLLNDLLGLELLLVEAASL